MSFKSRFQGASSAMVSLEEQWIRIRAIDHLQRDSLVSLEWFFPCTDASDSNHLCVSPSCYFDFDRNKAISCTLAHIFRSQAGRAFLLALGIDTWRVWDAALSDWFISLSGITNKSRRKRGRSSIEWCSGKINTGRRPSKNGERITTWNFENLTKFFGMRAGRILCRIWRNLNDAQRFKTLEIELLELGHSLVRSHVHSHRSLTHLLCTARFARALRCARSFARSLTRSLPSSSDREIFLSNFQSVLNHCAVAVFSEGINVCMLADVRCNADAGYAGS